MLAHQSLACWVNAEEPPGRKLDRGQKKAEGEPAGRRFEEPVESGGRWMPVQTRPLSSLSTFSLDQRWQQQSAVTANVIKDQNSGGNGTWLSTAVTLSWHQYDSCHSEQTL